MTMKTTHRLYMKAVSDRRKQILHLRQLGVTWKAIAVQMGITRQRAQQIGAKK